MSGAISNIWYSMSSWFSPTVLFCLLNLVIGTIFLTSNLKSHNKNPPHENQNQPDDYNPHNPSHPTQLARPPSFLERVRSINFSLYGSDSLNQFQPETHHTDSVQTQLARTPSILERVWSNNFSLHRSDSIDPSQPEDPVYRSDSLNAFQPETHHTDPVQTQLARTPSILERVWSNNFSLHRSDSIDPSQPEDPVQTQLTRAPSFLERVKSFNFSLYGYDHPDPNHHYNEDHDHHVTRTKSDTTCEGEGNVAAAAARMRKSASEKGRAEEEEEEEEEVRRPATVREGKRTASFFGEDEKVDEKADDFINRFKQQLKLQRLDSLLRYKEMLTRGSGR